MDEIAEKLQERWVSQHKESAEEAFALKDDGFVRETGPSFFQKAKDIIPETVLQARK